MKAISFYLDECISHGLAANDAEIARKIGVHRSAVSQWRLNMTAPAEDAAAKLDELIGKPEVMAECAAARAKTPEGRRAWERLARIAAAAVVVASVAPHNKDASTSQYATHILAFTVIRSGAGYTWRRIAELSIHFRRIFQQCAKGRFAAVAHGCIGA